MEIPEGYATSSTDPYEKPAADIVERVNKVYFLWKLCRSELFDEEIYLIVPNIIATESLLQENCEYGITTMAFMDAIFSAILNTNYVRSQRDKACGVDSNDSVLISFAAGRFLVAI